MLWENVLEKGWRMRTDGTMGNRLSWSECRFSCGRDARTVRVLVRDQHSFSALPTPSRQPRPGKIEKARPCYAPAAPWRPCPLQKRQVVMRGAGIRRKHPLPEPSPAQTWLPSRMLLLEVDDAVLELLVAVLVAEQRNLRRCAVNILCEAGIGSGAVAASEECKRTHVANAWREVRRASAVRGGNRVRRRGGGLTVAEDCVLADELHRLMGARG